MRDLFFYGTLCHVPLLEIVLGRSGDDLTVEAATLPDHAAKWVLDQPYPMILSAPGEAASGVLLSGVSRQDVERLTFYEGGFDYTLAPVDVITASGRRARAEVFLPPAKGGGDAAVQPGAPWSLTEWQDRWGAMTERAATEVMSYFGQMEAQQIARWFPAIRRRAWAWLAARQRPVATERTPEHDIEVIDHRRAYMDFFGMEEAVLRHRRYDGTMSAAIERSALMVGDASVVLPYDPKTDTVLLVEQFRAPVFLAGDPAPWIWEPVAGLVDPGETPEETAHREAWEEAGVGLERLERVGRAYSSTGSSGEFLHLFVGIADLEAERGAGGGVAGEGEDILVRLFSCDELMARLDGGAFRDLPLLTTALWLARHRDRLRAQAAKTVTGP